MFVKKMGGEWYVCRNPGGSSNFLGKRGKKVIRNWFLIKAGISSGYIPFTNLVVCPKELIGKKIRLKLEIIEFPTTHKKVSK